MCNLSKNSSFSVLSIEDKTKQVVELIEEKAKGDTILPRTYESILKALISGDGFAFVRRGIVYAYAECREREEAHTIHSVSSKPGLVGGRRGKRAMANRLRECWKRNPEKGVVLACSKSTIGFYQFLGFVEQTKEKAPEYIRGGRDEESWMSSDRVWMVCTDQSHKKQKEVNPMAKPNAFVKISGDLLQNTEVCEWLRELVDEYSVAVCIGGGEQINKAFLENNIPIEFGPLGRITQTFAQRQLARDILEQNQALIQDMLDDQDINARAMIPVEDIGGVLCHINGDIMVLAAYNGYDKLFLLTTKERVEKKKLWLKNLVEIFDPEEKRNLDKIEVIGY